MLNLAQSTSKISLLDSELLSCGDAQVEVQSILYHQAVLVKQILNDTDIFPIHYLYLVLYGVPVPFPNQYNFEFRIQNLHTKVVRRSEHSICYTLDCEAMEEALLALPMLRVFSLKAQGKKGCLKPSKPCHVGIHLIALAEYS